MSEKLTGELNSPGLLVVLPHRYKMTRMSLIRCAVGAAILVSGLSAQTGALLASGASASGQTKAQDTSPGATSAGTTSHDSASLVPIKAVRAIYPIAAEKDKLEGQVVVKIAVSEAGDVESVDIVSGNPTLALGAIDAAKQWKFKPFVQDEKPAKASTKLTFNFVFRDQMSDGPAALANRTSRQETTSVTELTVVRVSRNVAQQMVLQKIEPVYPLIAKTARIQGTVVMLAVIGKQGTITALRLISGHPLLAAAALDAVKEWQFRPYLLNGEPVEVQTTIEVHFTLIQRPV